MMPGKKMAVVLLTGILMTALWAPLDLRGQSKPKAQVEKNQPIEIVSDRLDAYHEKRMVVFSGNAVATQGVRTIRADVLTIFYKEDKNKEEKKTAGKPAGDAEAVGDLERVEAKGHVTITEPNRIVTGEDAVYEQGLQKITMTGNPVLREGANVIRGDRVVVFLDENRGVVESAQNKRVTATIYPGQNQEKKR
jgi:lipopolysaccharide export system protein LptA